MMQGKGEFLVAFQTEIYMRGDDFSLDKKSPQKQGANEDPEIRI